MRCYAELWLCSSSLGHGGTTQHTAHSIAAVDDAHLVPSEIRISMWIRGQWPDRLGWIFGGLDSRVRSVQQGIQDIIIISMMIADHNKQC